MTDWKKLTVGDLCDTISDTYHRKDNNVVLVNTSDVLKGKILNHQLVENKNLKGQFKKTFKKDDILYSEIRPANKRFAYIDFDSEDYIASTKLMVLRRKSDKITNKYLYYCLTNDLFVDSDYSIELQIKNESSRKVSTDVAKFYQYSIDFYLHTYKAIGF